MSALADRLLRVVGVGADLARQEVESGRTQRRLADIDTRSQGRFAEAGMPAVVNRAGMQPDRQHGVRPV